LEGFCNGRGRAFAVTIDRHGRCPIHRVQHQRKKEEEGGKCRFAVFKYSFHLKKKFGEKVDERFRLAFFRQKKP
jgi:hypothetical protein